jgi:hypothetical protein
MNKFELLRDKRFPSKLEYKLNITNGQNITYFKKQSYQLGSPIIHTSNTYGQSLIGVYVGGLKK